MSGAEFLDAILYGQDHDIYPNEDPPTGVLLAISEALCFVTDCTIPPDTTGACEVHG